MDRWTECIVLIGTKSSLAIINVLVELLSDKVHSMWAMLWHLNISRSQRNSRGVPSRHKNHRLHIFLLQAPQPQMPIFLPGDRNYWCDVTWSSSSHLWITDGLVMPCQSKRMHTMGRDAYPGSYCAWCISTFLPFMPLVAFCFFLGFVICRLHN